MLRPEWYREKSRTVDPEEITVCGIIIQTRWGDVYEMIELMEMAYHLATRGMDEYVDKIFLDSKSCSFAITLTEHKGLRGYEEIAKSLWNAICEREGRDYEERVDFFSFFLGEERLEFRFSS